MSRVGDELQVARIVLADEDAAFIAGPDQARLDRPIAKGRVVAEIGRGAQGQGRPGGEHAIEEIAPRDAQLAHGAVEVGGAGDFFFGFQIDSHG